jgi:Holliday junction resolvasome RuvABC endonuclease subunit
LIQTAQISALASNAILIPLLVLRGTIESASLSRQGVVLLFAGFDLGASFGYAVLDSDGKRVTSGTLKCKKRDPVGLYNLYTDLRLVFLNYPIQHVGYEKVHQRHRSKAAATAYGGYEALLYLCVADNKLSLSQFSVQAIKKLATSFSDADKTDMEAAALTRWQYVVGTDDEADALWIAEACRLEVVGVESKCR